MIAVSNLTMRFGPQILFDSASFQLNPGNRYGVVGANGSGKSTLLKILTNEIHPEEGEISIPSALTLGVLDQDQFKFESILNTDVVLMGKRKLWEAIQVKRELESHIQMDEKDGYRLAEVEEQIAQYNGYEADAKIRQLLTGLGIQPEDQAKQLKDLSGGFRIRVLLAQCLFSEPDVLFLDEPTNHLDIVSIKWMEDYLMNFGGTSVVISHDRQFLNRISTHILDVDYEAIRIYTGNYDQFLDQKGLEAGQKNTEIERQEKKKQELQQFVDRFKAKATKARQAQSRAKQIEKMEEISIKRSSRMSPHFNFELIRPSGKTVVDILKVGKNYGKQTVLKDISLKVEKGDKLAIVGPNGVGKSTLIKIINGLIEASAGTSELGYEVHPGYFPQDHKETIQSGTTAYEWLYSYSPSEEIGKIRSLLGRVLLTGDDVHKSSDALSGGESSRLIFSSLMLTKPNLLLLDEPTNHMDLESIEALSKSLKEYEGTIICVSHDREFIRSFATEVLEIKHEGVELFDGGYDEYLRKSGFDYLDRQLDQNDQNKIISNSSDKIDRKQAWLKSKESGKLQKQIQQIEEKIEALELGISELDEKLMETDIYTDSRKSELEEIITRKKKITEEMDQLNTDWEKKQERLDDLMVS